MLPQLIVFDLDFTLWDCGGTWCDCLTPPFILQNGQPTDRLGRRVQLYEDVPTLLERCDRDSVPMALASRTEEPTWAKQLVELLGLAERFAFAEIYPSSKLKHFAALRETSGVEYGQMLFFDDEMRNIVDVSTLGVTCIHVKNGIDQDVFETGLESFQNRRTYN